MRRYRNKFDLVSDILWLAISGGAIVAVAVFFGDQEIAWLALLPVCLLLWPFARWLTRRLGFDDE
jgi:hypothetical protein